MPAQSVGANMRFCNVEIEAARRLRNLGLPWEPQVGNYVFDELGICSHPSPFQPNVYFILNYHYFMRVVGGEKRFKSGMLWLLTWEDLRTVLRALGVTDVDVAIFLSNRKSVELGQERLALYAMVEDRLASRIAQ